MIKNDNNSISSVLNTTTVIGKIYAGILKVYEAWKKLLASGIPPLTLLKCKQADLVDYKVYGESVQAILPSEYQQVEYIESDGTQYIEIDYIASGITSSKGKYQITDTSKARFLFGSRGANGDSFYGYNWGGGAPYKYYNSYKSGLVTSVEIDDKIHTFYKNKGALYIDDTFIQARSDIDFTTPHNMNIFACYNDNVAGYLPASAKLYYLQFYDNETLMVDLIPCYRKSDNEIGMYDLVNNVFYTNLGTGVFLKGSDTPTPNTPIEVESVGDKSRNLIPYPWKDTSKEENGLTFTDNGDGSVTINGIATAFTQYYFIQTKSSVIKSNVIYTLTGIKGGSSTTYELRVTDNLTSARALFDGSMAFSYENTDKFSLFIYIRTGSVFDNVVIKPQLEEGEVATEFVPYNKYKIPVKVRGKNSINPNKFIGGSIVEYNGVQCYKYLDGGSGNFAYIDEFKENTQYIFTIKIYSSDTTKNTAIKFTYTDGTSSSEAISKFNTKYSFITSSGKTLQSITGDWYWGIARYIDLTATQLEEGTTATNYEPYIEPVTTNIYLNEPLRKIGNYADYIDFKKGKVIRIVRKLILKQAGNIYEWQGKKGVVFYSPTLDTNYNRNTLCLSNVNNAFSLRETQNVSSGMWIGVNSANIYWIGVLDVLGFTTLSEFNTWLSNNSVYILYVSSLEPTEEEIELPNIPTHKGTNTIEVDTTITPSNMEVTYLGKK